MHPDQNTPRWLDRNALAAYVSLRVDQIPRFVRTGQLPQPSYQLGPKSPRWWSGAIDEAFGMSPSPALSRGAAGLAEIILRKGKLGRGPGRPR